MLLHENTPFYCELLMLFQIMMLKANTFIKKLIVKLANQYPGVQFHISGLSFDMVAFSMVITIVDDVH